MDLQGKTALVTGGTTGIGFATAKLFQQHGARVAITGQDDARLATAHAELGGDSLALRLDVRSMADFAALNTAIATAFGEADSSCFRLRPLRQQS